MANTTNYSWETPDDTDLVKDGAAAIRTLGTAIDTTVFNNASAAIAKTIVDAKGDLIAATAADTVSRLAVGSNDTVLTADSSTATGLKWASPASGSMTLISTTTLTGSSIVLSSIPSTYNNLVLIIRGFTPASDGFGLKLILNSSTGNNYYYAQASSSSSNDGFGATLAFGSNNQDNGTSQAFHRAEFYDYANTSTWKVIQMNTAINNATTTTNVESQLSRAVYNSTSAISSIEILAQVGNLSAGTALLYGVK
jgi:hypothetical protein